MSDNILPEETFYFQGLYGLETTNGLVVQDCGDNPITILPGQRKWIFLDGVTEEHLKQVQAMFILPYSEVKLEGTGAFFLIDLAGEDVTLDIGIGDTIFHFVPFGVTVDYTCLSGNYRKGNIGILKNTKKDIIFPPNTPMTVELDRIFNPTYWAFSAKNFPDFIDRFQLTYYRGDGNTTNSVWLKLTNITDKNITLDITTIKIPLNQEQVEGYGMEEVLEKLNH